MTALPDLPDLRVIYLAPRSGASGVGDYADDFVAALAPHVKELVELRHGAAGEETVRSVLRLRRELRQVLKTDPGTPCVVHSELSGGAVAAFWAIAGLRGIRRTATVHDPPRPVWYPFLTRTVKRGRILNRLIHDPLHWALTPLERRAMREVDLFTGSAAGTASTREARIGRSVTTFAHPIPARPEISAAQDRPLALGLFGHVYSGKGFDLVPEIRRLLDPDIELVVAGRGTEALRPVPGVRILGAVEGKAEAEFFASIRVLLLPYTRPRVGGLQMVPTSGAHLRSVAFRTPSVGFASPPMEDLVRAGLSQAVHGGVTQLVAAANDLVRSEQQLATMARALGGYHRSLDDLATVAPFLAAWDEP